VALPLLKARQNTRPGKLPDADAELAVGVVA